MPYLSNTPDDIHNIEDIIFYKLYDDIYTPFGVGYDEASEVIINLFNLFNEVGR